MSQINNPMEIFKLLDKTNCRECREPTCLAFAASVFKGQRQLDECPHLGRDILERFGGTTQKPAGIEADQEASLNQLKKKIATIDLPSSAERLGGRFSKGKLTIKIPGNRGPFAMDHIAEERYCDPPVDMDLG